MGRLRRTFPYRWSGRYGAARMQSNMPGDQRTRLEHYRDKADEADAKAASAHDPQVKMLWGQIARSWRHLADHIARLLPVTDSQTSEVQPIDRSAHHLDKGEP